MCGIVAVLNGGVDASQTVKAASQRLRHRGPDWTGIAVSSDGTCVMGHERLSIVGVMSGAQPLLGPRCMLA